MASITFQCSNRLHHQCSPLDDGTTYVGSLKVCQCGCHKVTRPQANPRLVRALRFSLAHSRNHTAWAIRRHS